MEIVVVNDPQPTQDFGKCMASGCIAYTRQDLMARKGVRVPSSPNAQKSLKAAYGISAFVWLENLDTFYQKLVFLGVCSVLIDLDRFLILFVTSKNYLK